MSARISDRSSPAAGVNIFDERRCIASFGSAVTRSGRALSRRAGAAQKVGCGGGVINPSWRCGMPPQWSVSAAPEYQGSLARSRPPDSAFSAGGRRDGVVADLGYRLTMTGQRGTASVVDRFGRPIRDLRISVTDRCNFRCVYCMPKEVFGRDYQFLE